MSLVVSTTHGSVVGYVDTHPLSDRSTAALAPGSELPVKKWLGIPYAQAGRFERPSAPEPWTETKDCFEFGSMFPQSASGLEVIYGGGKVGVLPRSFIQQSEDSFTVNVFAPEGVKPTDKLPVMYFIYGGSLNNGSSDRFLYDFTGLVRSATQPFIGVTSNYRTNIFGFCSGEDLKATDSDGLAGNYGAYDCIATLEWIRDNIANFGGDPERVTVFGESAGAFLVSSLLVSRKKLFHQAILQSGAPGTMQIRALPSAYPGYASVLSTLGIEGASAEERIKALRAVPFADLLAAHTAAHQFGGVGMTIEEGEHAIWKEGISETIKRGEADPWIKSIILGTNEDEGSMFTLLFKPMLTFEGFSGYISRFPDEIKSEYETRFPSTSPLFVAPADLATASDYLTTPASIAMAEQLFIRPARRLAESMSESGECKVYLYRCREVVDRISTTPVNLGSMHSVELPLVFNVNTLWDANSHEAATAKVMGHRWVNLAATGSPNGAEDTVEWKQFKRAEPTWFAINSGGVVQNEIIV